jgi:acyl dehydratase
MPLNLDAVGKVGEPVERSWTERDVLLYALGVGAGAEDPTGSELPFTTENSHDIDLAVLPTFPVLLGGGSRGVDIGTFNPAMLVHGEQGITLHGTLPTSGTVQVTGTVTGIYDKGSGALLASESAAVDPASGETLFTSRMSAFIRGEGGFGGERGPSGDAPAPVVPERAPDEVVTYPTRIDQALLYRLSGDRNPLHSDPWFAAQAGFDRPILHGLCTYGFTGRALLHGVCGSDPARFGSMDARFSRPVMPGDRLTVQMWRLDDDRTVLFRTQNQAGDTVIDRGVFTLAS